MNLNQTVAILFWLNKHKLNREGLAPIWIRITIDGKRAECSTRKHIHPKFWNQESNQVSSTHPDAELINDHLAKFP